MKHLLFILLFILFFNNLILSSPYSNTLIGYWHNWNDSNSPYIHIDQIDSKYDIIEVAFAMPISHTDMTMTFVPEVVSQNVFISKVQTLQSYGKKVLISIGGANAYIDLSDTDKKQSFVNSMTNIINTYGFDGIDIDIEHGNSILINNGGTIANPTNPSMINLIDAIKSIMSNFRSNHSNKMLLTMAPETAYVQGGQSGFGSIWGGYLPIIHLLRDSIDILQVQLYNSGTMYGIDGNVYSQGTADFIVAMTEAAIRGFNTQGGFFNGLPANKIAIGLPACPSAAGGGFTDTAIVRKAVRYLKDKGQKPGNYTLIGNGYSDLRGLMTWSINWDAVSTCGGRYGFAENWKRIFNTTHTLQVINGTGSGDYEMDEKVTISAKTAVNGYKFSKWSGDTTYLSNIYQETTIVTIPYKNISVTAVFEPIRYRLTVNNGSGSGNYIPEQKITVIANPPLQSYKFSQWNGSVEFLSNKYSDTTTITVPEKDVDITAEYELIKYKLTVNKGLGAGEYLPGKEITIIAEKPIKGYSFLKWSGNTDYISDIANDTASIIMPEKDVDITAEYKLITYKLTVNKGLGSGEYLPGKEITIIAEKPNKGYKFLKWSGNTDYISDIANDTASIIMPEKDVDITAEYELIKYKLFVLNGTGTGEYEIGAKVTVTANPLAIGHKFEKWTGDVLYLNDSTMEETLLTVPDKDISIAASYVDITGIDEYTENSTSIYPNPASYYVHIQCINSDAKILDCLGKEIHCQHISTYAKIDISNFNEGVYFVITNHSVHKLILLR